VTDKATGERSTTTLGKNIFAASLAGVDDAAAAAVQKERNWRFGCVRGGLCMGVGGATCAGVALVCPAVTLPPPSVRLHVHPSPFPSRYAKHVVKNVEVCLQSPQAAVRVSEQGLEAALQSFEFVRDGKSTSLATAMSSISASFHTGHLKGSKPKPTTHSLEVPYKKDVLKGQALLDQLKK
jgi:hypothetical protein